VAVNTSDLKGNLNGFIIFGKVLQGQTYINYVYTLSDFVTYTERTDVKILIGPSQRLKRTKTKS
jgi:hypothetical protein